jgi:hypothetical protein
VVALELLELPRFMNNMPPPLPLSVSGQDPNQFSKTAANTSLILAAIAWGLSLGFSVASKNLHLSGRFLGFLALGISGLSFFLLLVGSIMGILALLLMKPGNRGTIVLRSLAGVAISALFVAIFIPNFIQARARTLAQRDASLKAEAEQKAAAAARTNSAPVSLNKFTQAQDDTPKSNPAENPLVQKASDAYVLRIQAVQGAYKDALAKLSAAHVLSTKDLATHDILQERREVVENFLKCNANLKNFTSASEDNFRGELARLNVSQATTEAKMADFHKSTAPRLPVLLAMRKQDDDMGRGMLAVLDLLEATWGHWSYDQTTGHVRFESQAFVEQYNIDLREINDAVQQGEVSKKQLTKAVTQSAVQ